MAELTLEWVEGGVSRSERIQPNQPSQNPGTVRIGRDSQRCDIVLTDSSVSGLQAEVYYQAASQSFYLRSLRDTNPPIINGQPITTGEALLGHASTLTLGRVVLNVKVNPLPVGLPPTEVSPAGRGVPPTEVSSPYSGNAASPPSSAPSPTPYYPSQPASDQQGPKVWVWVIAGVLVIGGGALAWPYVSSFLGLSEEPAISTLGSDRSDSDQDGSNTDANEDPSPGSRGDSFGDNMGDLTTYTHPSGLFEIKIPRSWNRTDASNDREVILRWVDAQTGSGLVVDLFRARRQFSQEELSDLGRRLVSNAFGSRPDFRVGESKRKENGVVELSWEFSAANDQVLGATFTEQAKNTVSVVSIYVLRSDFDQVKDTFKAILSSYRFDPAVDIP